MRMSKKVADKIKGKKSTRDKIHPTRYSVGFPNDPNLDLSMILDGSNLFYRNASVPNLSTLTNKAGQKTGALMGTLKSIIAEIKYWQPKFVYFVLDKNGSHRKKVLNAEVQSKSSSWC